MVAGSDPFLTPIQQQLTSSWRQTYKARANPENLFLIMEEMRSKGGGRDFLHGDELGKVPIFPFVS